MRDQTGPAAQAAETPKPLTDYPAGSRLKIVSLACGCKARGKLCSLGLTPGAEIKLLSGGQGCRVQARGACMALGCGMADKVLAVPCTDMGGPETSPQGTPGGHTLPGPDCSCGE